MKKFAKLLYGLIPRTAAGRAAVLVNKVTHARDYSQVR